VPRDEPVPNNMRISSRAV